MLLYLTVMLKPLIPILYDGFEHAFAGVEHIATVHALYGANHLQNKLADTAENENKGSHVLNEGYQVPFHIAVSTNNTVFIPNEIFIAYQLYLTIVVPEYFISRDERPPRFS